jgi:hypothetical protein
MLSCCAVAVILDCSSTEEVGSVFWFLWTGYFLPIEIHHQIIGEVYGNSILENGAGSFKSFGGHPR